VCHDRAVTPVRSADCDPTRLRESLAALGYTERALAARLGGTDLSAVLDSDGRSIYGRTAGGSALDTMMRLFVVGMPLERDAVEPVIPRDVLADLQTTGILGGENDHLVPRARLLPCEDLMLASDLPLVSAAGVRPDYVMGAGPSSLTLARFSVRTPVERALDLGTGSGVLAFLAARHSRLVVAVERNPRALRFAAFNAWLNGVDNVALVQGSFMETSRPAAFDFVTCNPPYVIAPAHRYVFRDSDRGADGLCEALVHWVGTALRPGGYAQILCHWAHVTGERWQDRLARWCADNGCDAWVLRFESYDVGQYATSWTTATEDADPERTAASVAAWLAYFARERIEAVGYGIVMLRARPGGANWFRVQDAPSKVAGAAGGHVLRGFDGFDFLDATRDDAALLDTCLRIAPEIRLEQVAEPGPTGWQLVAAKLRLARGLAYEGEIEPAVSELVVRCDGTRRLRDVLAEVTGARLEDADAATAAALGAVRTLVARGFLLPPAT
jgi:SAM-dependent methyltransferase